MKLLFGYCSGCTFKNIGNHSATAFSLQNSALTFGLQPANAMAIDQLIDFCYLLLYHFFFIGTSGDFLLFSTSSCSLKSALLHLSDNRARCRFNFDTRIWGLGAQNTLELQLQPNPIVSTANVGTATVWRNASSSEAQSESRWDRVSLDIDAAQLQLFEVNICAQACFSLMAFIHEANSPPLSLCWLSGTGGQDCVICVKNSVHTHTIGYNGPCK